MIIQVFPHFTNTWTASDKDLCLCRHGRALTLAVTRLIIFFEFKFSNIRENKNLTIKSSRQICRIKFDIRTVTYRGSTDLKKTLSFPNFHLY